MTDQLGPGIRVAVVYDCLFPYDTGGGERVYRRMSELFAERGASVTYLTRSYDFAGAREEPAFVVEPIWSGQLYDGTGTRTSRGALAFSLAVYRSLRHSRGSYDLVVASALPVLTLIAAHWAIRGTPAYLVSDWLEVWSWRQWRKYSGTLVGTLGWVLQSVGSRSADLHTVNSLFTAERLRRYRGGKNQLVLGLVDLAGEPHAPVPARKPPTIIFIGRHIPDKRINALLAAFDVARRTLLDLHLIVVGSGPQSAGLHLEIARLGLVGAVDIVGRVTDELLHELLSTASALVTASAREGFGLVVAEAASWGVPSVVVAGPDNAAVELIEEGVNGFIAGSVDAESLAAAIVRAVDSGNTLRVRTAAWYEVERVQRGLGASVDAILQRFSRARDERRPR